MSRAWLAVLMLTGLAAYSQAQADPASVKVTYANDGASLKAVFEELSQKAGVRLEAISTLHELPLIVDVKDVTLKDLMDRIAKATYGRWTKGGEAFRLEPSAEQVAKARQTDFEFRTACFRKLQKNLRDELNPAAILNDKSAEALARQGLMLLREGYDADSRAIRAAQVRLPSHKLAQRLLTLIPPETLAGQGFGRRVVFTLQPNRMQRALPSDARGIVQSYVEEQSLWAKTLDRTVPESIFSQLPGLYGDAMRLVDDRFDPSAEPHKVLLACFVEPGGWGIRAELSVIDKSGSARIATTLNHLLPALEEPVAAVQNLDEPLFEFDEIAQELAARIRTFGTANLKDWKPASAQLRERLLQPERFDPCSLGVGSMFRQIANSKGLQLVACPSDSTLGYTVGALVRKWKPSEVFARITAARQGVRLAEADAEWLTVTFRPAIREYGAGQPLSRRTVGGILRRLDKEGRMDLENQAQIALATDEEMSMIHYLAVALGPCTFENARAWNVSTRGFLRLHGMLTATQRTSLYEGSRFGLEQLTLQQREIIATIVFDERYLSTDKKSQRTASESGEAPYGSGEPTEEFPDGLPNDMALTCRRSEEAILLAMRSDNGSAPTPTPYPYRSLASLLNIQQDSGMLDEIQLQGFSTALQTRYSYTIRFSRGLSSSQSLEDVVRTGAWVKSLSQLPSEVQAAIQKQRDSLRPPKSRD